jgi:hypothetical protein
MNALNTNYIALCLGAILLWLVPALSKTADDQSTHVAAHPTTLPVTEACLDQIKPSCVFETHYLPEPDGSNTTKLVLVYPQLDRRTNAQNIAYVVSTNVAVPTNRGFPLGTPYTPLPVGGHFALPAGTSVHGVARVVSVERLKPVATRPRISRSSLPTITITEPTETVTFRPMIQVKGTSDKPLRHVQFDLTNDNRQQRDQAGFITDVDFDTSRMEDTTNYFECMDIALLPGTNRVVVRCEDFDGHWVATNLVSVLRLDLDHTAPVISPQWPVPGRQVSGESFTVHGYLDDYTARIVARIAANGQTRTVEGEVERDGRFWVDNLPLLARTNLLTLTATDAAGNSAVTNLPIIKSEATLTIDPVPEDQLWQLQVMVTGKVKPAAQRVWVNGLPARVSPDGTWSVRGVTLARNGVAIFEAVSVPDGATVVPSLTASRNPSLVSPPKESVSISADLGTNAITLNASQPTYGSFSVHLTGTAGRDFVLCASTNLVDWTPILTNRNSGPTFDYIDTNATAYGCRFFRIIPTR